jgi:hypothetical protein
MEDTNHKDTQTNVTPVHSTPLENIKEFSIIVPALVTLFDWFSYFSPARIIIGYKDNNIHPKNPAFIDHQKKRSKKIEVYIISCLLVEVFCLLIIQYEDYRTGFMVVIKNIIIFFIFSRIFDLFQSMINVNIFAPLRNPQSGVVSSVRRTVVLSLINLVELILCFALVYFHNRTDFNKVLSLSDSLYYSVITQITIGYGDIYPLRWMRIVASIQALMGYLFSIFMLGRFISLLPKYPNLTHEDD